MQTPTVAKSTGGSVRMPQRDDQHGSKQDENAKTQELDRLRVQVPMRAAFIGEAAPLPSRLWLLLGQWFDPQVR